jgi:DNA-binding MarR family transcriptional regulator
MRIHLTRKGRDLEAELVPLVHKFDALITRDLSREEVEQFKALMRRLRATVDEVAGIRWSEAGR